MTKLTDLQCIALSAASQRDNGSLHPLPDTISGAGARLEKGLAALINAGFAEERQIWDMSIAHRSDEDIAFGLFITDAGLAAIGAGTSATSDRTAPIAALPAVTNAPSKAATVIALLQRPEGATLADLIEATGWLPHTTRAALTGIRHKGHVISSDKVDGVRTYRIATPEVAQ